MKKEVTIIIVALVIILGGAYFLNKPTAGSTKYDALAQCIAKSGATFYGAFWCPHCKAQKELFGASVKYLPYVECSTPDGQGQTPICVSKGIQSYPTWIFADGSQQSGEVSLADLASKTSCVLPAGDATSTTAVTPGAATQVKGSTTTGTTNGLPDGKL